MYTYIVLYCRNVVIQMYLHFQKFMPLCCFCIGKSYITHRDCAFKMHIKNCIRPLVLHLISWAHIRIECRFSSAYNLKSDSGKEHEWWCSKFYLKMQCMQFIMHLRIWMYMAESISCSSIVFSLTQYNMCMTHV